jgi:hypothetical protein
MPLLKTTPKISSVIEEASKYCKEKKNEIQQEILKINKEKPEFVDFKILKEAISLLPTKTTIHETIQGTEYYFPKVKKVVNPEYQKIYEKNLKMEQDLKYSEMMKTVIKPKDDKKPFSSFKGQFGTGLDMVITMGTFFTVFYFASQYMFNFQTIPRILFGTFGAVLALIFESVLFIIRANKYDKFEEKQKKKEEEFTKLDLVVMSEELKKRIKNQK